MAVDRRIGTEGTLFAMRPWWWIDEAERARLGLGTTVRRTERGVLFGDALEILPRCDDAPVRLGPIALRLWGSTTDRRGRVLLRAVVDLLGPRLADDFEPDAVALDAAIVSTTVIDVPSVCDRACVFCHVSQQPMGERVAKGTDADVERALAGAKGDLLFTGNDALSHPRIVEWIAAAGGRAVSVIGPPRSGVTPLLAPQLARAGLRKWITALLGASPAMHDRIAGREGAHHALVESAAAMREAGIAVELVTPLIAPLLPELPAIVAHARALSSGRHTLLAYAPDTMVGRAYDALVPAFDALRDALPPIAGSGVSIDALPLCVVPESMRSGAALDRTDARLQVIHPESTCSGCELKPRCPGIASTVERAVSTVGLRRQTSSCGGGAGPS